jgi:excinuclease ABC subunit B
VGGTVILYGDNVTKSMDAAIAETTRRREKQLEYNRIHGIVPKSIVKGIDDPIALSGEADYVTVQIEDGVRLESRGEIRKLVSELRKKMLRCARELDFEEAGRLRDRIIELENYEVSTLKRASRTER